MITDKLYDVQRTTQLIQIKGSNRHRAAQCRAIQVKSALCPMCQITSSSSGGGLPNALGGYQMAWWRGREVMGIVEWSEEVTSPSAFCWPRALTTVYGSTDH